LKEKWITGFPFQNALGHPVFKVSQSNARLRSHPGERGLRLQRPVGGDDVNAAGGDFRILSIIAIAGVFLPMLSRPPSAPKITSTLRP